MAEEIIFPNAPITEAILDIRCNVDPSVDLNQIASFQDEIREKFPNRKQRFRWQSKFQVKDEGKKVEIDQPLGSIDGYLFESTDKKKIVQARLDGFTFNRLRPYENWTVFRDEAKALWNRYLKIVAPKNVTGIALRYINKIEIPLPLSDFKDYILTIPELAPEIPPHLAHFLMRLTIPDEKSEAYAILTETIE